ncbi:D-3-phosphoglycerate dehydrogenase SerA [Thermoclostridium stercorarium subsp. stercorarium DSM 8532]|uniref:D-3-phosphoglycerate dehydrogenase n=2 Tax=Thermoclostridium stercorarium TaxID=1510 RepID=L7VNB8_THES1|nr:phosphoglycerate dehydrogenase [Thermoclostridium stercorarium]AGC68144.1 D-3-phosphoglycerate dehydrogenase SerA [Thermoclostridium stercorarium subsp. stercorarium DSM 8532]AGI39170.1 D-3-phosphoglycerate dehydrogenase [Thermoclostridium stercorarium subsp. stercorarium DSM 8532]ANW98519.1 phosphoglycerate dehydrogenase [Thermoclostridium stercorarium subsp. thermolacticum DSM 2910]UZQ86671.1 phosphoglycerate dehydrogenase [Thermoclostridium stercorarium]
MARIIVTDKMAPDGIEYLKSKGFEVDTPFGISQEELLQVIENYDALIVRSATKVTKDVIERGKNLKVVGRAGNGVDNIDVEECTKRGIAVVNTPEGNIMAAAELTVAMIFAIFRNIPQAHHAAKNRDFRRNKFVGEELEGKTAGIIGVGKIGTIVARKLLGIGMKVVGYDPYVADEKFEQLGITRCENLEELLKVSDVITLHIPKSPQNVGLIGEKELKMCKKGVRIVNVARGGMIDEKALYNAIVEGHVAAAALDVLEKEPNYTKSPEEQDFWNPLLDLENVVYTPHLGASTKEANYNVSIGVAKLVEGVLNGELVPAVNMPPVSGDINQLRPYIDLAEKLGSIYYQAEKDRVTKIEVIYSGDIANIATKAITLAAVKGFLNSAGDPDVTYINAELKLRELGVKLVESKSSHLDKYTNLITVKFTTPNRDLSVSGTVFAKDVIRIVDFFGYKLDFEPTPHVLALQNIDVPGIIGKVGTLLGENNINIAAMQWSRNRKGEKAVSFVSVDTEVSDEILQKLLQIEGVLKASRLNF